MKKIISLLLCFLMLFSSGCIQKKESIKNQRRDYLTYSIDKFPKSLNNIGEKHIGAQDLILATFEGLVKEEDGEVIPALAEDWTISEDKIQYNFKIRDNAYWSNGEKIKSEDFVKFFSWILKSEDLGEYEEALHSIYGAKDYIEGKKDFKEVAINAKNNNILQIRLNHPCNYLLKVLSEPLFTLRKKQAYMDNWQNYYDKICYTGPFKISNILGDKKVVLVKNETYWNKREIIPKNIQIVNVGEKEEALACFEQSNNEEQEIDIVVDPPINEIGRLIEKYNVSIIPSLKSINLIFNLKNPIMRDNNFRKSINCAISRKNLDAALGKYKTLPTSAFVPQITDDGKGQKYRNENSYTSEDYSKAIEYLKISKYNKNEKIKILYEENSINNIIIKEIEKNIKEVLDIKIQLIPYNNDNSNRIIAENNYHMILKNCTASYDDATAFLQQWTSKSKHNLYGYNNNEFDRTLLKSNIEKDINKRKILLKEGERTLLGDLAFIPLYNYNTIVCMKPYVKGIYVNKKGNVIFNKAYMELKKEEN